MVADNQHLRDEIRQVLFDYENVVPREEAIADMYCLLERLQDNPWDLHHEMCGGKVAPEECPRCGARELTGGAVTVEHECCWQKVACDACGHRWIDVYGYSHSEEW